MLQQGIFQPPLKPQIYLNTLRKAEEELAALQPKRQGGDDDDEGGEEAAAGEGGAEGEDAADWKPIQVRAVMGVSVPANMKNLTHHKQGFGLLEPMILVHWRMSEFIA
jgi:hypothetical protein